jgi:hypothetical protein
MKNSNQNTIHHLFCLNWNLYWNINWHWFSPGTPVSSTIKTDHDITEYIVESGVKHNNPNSNINLENFNSSKTNYWCYYICSVSLLCNDINIYVVDTMVCTGCCATLDTIITYLFKRLTSKKKKNSPGAVRDSEAFLRILELHPDILQQVSSISAL